MGAGSGSYLGPIAQSLGSHVGTLIESSATHHASEQESRAADAANAARQQALSQIQGYEHPFLQTGQQASTQLATLLGLPSGDKTSGQFGALNQTFTPQDLQNEPGYQFQLQEGLRALQARDAAQGTLGAAGSTPTAALRNATSYAQGLAGTTYQNAWDRFMAQQNALYNRLSGVSGAGQGAAGVLSNASFGTGAGIAGTEQERGNNLANLILLRGGIQGGNAMRQGNYLASVFQGGSSGQGNPIGSSSSGQMGSANPYNQQTAGGDLNQINWGSTGGVGY